MRKSKFVSLAALSLTLILSFQNCGSDHPATATASFTPTSVREEPTQDPLNSKIILFSQSAVADLATTAHVADHFYTSPTNSFDYEKIQAQMPWFSLPGLKLIAWTDDFAASNRARLDKDGEATHLSPYTGLVAPAPVAPFQLSMNRALPGSSGFQMFEDKLGLNLHSDTFPSAPRFEHFRKKTMVAQIDFSPKPRVFKDQSSLSLAMSIKVPRLVGQNGGAANLWLYANICEAGKPDNCFCYGAGVADTRPTEASAFLESLFVDKDSGCVIVNSKIGLARSFIDSKTDFNFAVAEFNNFRKIEIQISPEKFLSAVSAANRRLDEVNANRARFGTDPTAYELTQVVINPELYIPEDAGTGHPFAHIGLGVQALQISLLHR